MASSITENGVVKTLQQGEGRPADSRFQPIFQAIQVKKLENQGKVRYKLVLSDGIHFVQGLMSTQLHASVNVDDLKDNCIIKVREFLTQSMQNRTLILVLNLEIVSPDVGHRINAPVTDIEASTAPDAVAALERIRNKGDQPAAQPLYNSTNAASRPDAAISKPSNPYGRSGASPVRSNPYGSSVVSPQTSAPIVRSAHTPSNITLISGLNMYNNRWTIEARVTNKSDIRTWSNARGEGSLFSCELLDSSDMDIRCTFFKEAVDKFYSVLEVGKCYTFTGGRLKVANQQYNTCKSGFEITFDQNAEIHFVPDAGQIKAQTYQFKKISEIEQVEEGKYVDILGVVQTVADPARLTSKKSGQELIKCDLTIMDDSGTQINCTLWGNKAEQAPSELTGQPIVAFRRCRVSDYGGKSLSGPSSYDINPDLPEARQMHHWWQTAGNSTAARSLSSTMGGGRMDNFKDRKDIASIKNESMGHGEKPDWLSFKATVSFLKKDKEGGAWYPACPNAGEPCKNLYKVTASSDGQWLCEKCNGHYPEPVRRWIFSGVVEDGTSSTWVSFFNDQAETLLGGLKADEAYRRSYEGEGGFDQDIYDSIFVEPVFTEWIFKCKVKNELVGEENRVKTSVYSLHPVDYVKESQDMLAEIAQF